MVYSKFRNMMKSILLLALVFCCAGFATAQSAAYDLYLKNDTLASPNVYEFDIFLGRTGATPLELATLQSIMTFNPAITPDSLSFTIVAGTSELNGSQQPTNAKLFIAGDELRMAPNAPPGSGSGTVISVTPGLRVGRFRLTSGAPFTTQKASIVWKNSGTNPVTKLNAYVGGIDSVVTDTTGHIDQLVNPTLSPLSIVTTSPLPALSAGIAYAETLQAAGGTLPYAWTVTAGALPPGFALSADGRVSGTSTVAGTYAFTIQVNDNATLSTSRSFSLTVNPAAASHLLFVQQPLGAVAGTIFSPAITVQLKDAFENNVHSAGDTVLVVLTSGTGVLTGTTTRLTSAAGVATFDDLSINSTGSKNITASRSGVTSATSAAFTITPGQPKTIVYLQQPSDAISDSMITPAVTVQVQDSLGNIVQTSGIAITTAIATGSGVLSGTTTQPTNSSGVATFANLSINLAGSKTLAASGSGLTPAISGNFVISAGPATHIVIIQQPTATVAGLTITPSVTARLRDAAGNNVQATGVQVTASLIGTGTLHGTLNKPTNSTGLATFNNLSIDSTGSKELRIASSGITPDTSSAFTVTPGAAAKLVFTQQPSNGFAGVPISPPVTLQLRDTLGNNVPIAGDSVTISLSGGSGSLNGTLTRLTYASGGVAFNDLIATQGGVKSLTASGPGLTSAVSNPFTMSTYTITATSGANGTISPPGAVSVVSGSNQLFTFTPNTGYHIDTLFVDGATQPVAGTYMFTNVSSDHTIRVVFAIDKFTITATTGANGAINPAGSVIVNYGADQSFTFSPSTGYHVDSLFVDGASAGQMANYTFTGVTTNHSIRVVFAINKFTITATAGANGAINPVEVSS